MSNLINEELETMKYLFGYQKGKVISEQTAPAAPATAAPATAAPATAAPTAQDVIMKIQTILKTKYGVNLGTSGPNKDGVDGKWGNLTQSAFESTINQLKK